MTHEVDRNGKPVDLWSELGDADKVEPVVLPVPVGDLDADAELEAMIAYDRSGP